MADFNQQFGAVLDQPWNGPKVKPRGQVLAPVFREPDPPEKFRYRAGNGLWINVRPEARGNNTYWFIDKMLNGQRFHIYVAPCGKLTRSLLENAAQHIAG